jgi:hypothetical protein
MVTRAGRDLTGVWTLRRRYGPRRGGWPAPGGGSAVPGRPHREGFRSALAVRTDPVWLRFHPLSHRKRQTAGAGTPAGWPAPRFPRAPVCVPRQTSRVTILSHTENISLGCRENGKPASRSHLLRLSLDTAGDASIDSEIAPGHHPQARYFPACAGELPAAHVHAVFTSARSVTPIRPEYVSGVSSERKRRKLPAARPCSPADVIRPQLFLPRGTASRAFAGSSLWSATGGAVPARCGRSARWPAVP